jgi:hypothetical protein
LAAFTSITICASSCSIFFSGVTLTFLVLGYRPDSGRQGATFDSGYQKINISIS